MRHKRITNNFRFSLVELFLTVICFFFSFFILNEYNREYFIFTKEYVILLFIIIPIWAGMLYTIEIMYIPRVRSILSIFIRIFNFNCVGFLIIFLCRHLFKYDLISHYFLLTFSIVNFLCLSNFRFITYRIFKQFRASTHNIRNIIVYADSSSIKFIEDIINHKEWGYRIIMIFSNSDEIKDKYLGKIRVYPDKASIKKLLDVDIIDEVIYAKYVTEDARQIIGNCQETGVIFKFSKMPSKLTLMYANIDHFQKEPFDVFTDFPKNYYKNAFKTFSEFWISILIFIVFFPFMVIIAILIKETSEGPIFFIQKRVGLRGRKFNLYKFRTMVSNAESLLSELKYLNESDGPAFKIKKDPRITKFGNFLRKTGLDELPQLFNVLKGEMALIGPRPNLIEEVSKYEKRWYLKRLSIKPGITCSWQIQPKRNDILFDKWMSLDIEYIDDKSLNKDLRLLIKTIGTVIHATGH